MLQSRMDGEVGRSVPTKNVTSLSEDTSSSSACSMGTERTPLHGAFGDFDVISLMNASLSSLDGDGVLRDAAGGESPSDDPMTPPHADISDPLNNVEEEWRTQPQHHPYQSKSQLPPPITKSHSFQTKCYSGIPTRNKASVLSSISSPRTFSKLMELSSLPASELLSRAKQTNAKKAQPSLSSITDHRSLMLRNALSSSTGASSSSLVGGPRRLTKSTNDLLNHRKRQWLIDDGEESQLNQQFAAASVSSADADAKKKSNSGATRTSTSLPCFKRQRLL